MGDKVKESKVKKTKGNLSRFFRDLKSELKKVIWPTRPQVINYTVTVIATCLVVGAIVWLADFGFSQLAQLVFIR